MMVEDLMENGLISPGLLGKRLGMTGAELALLAGLDRETLTRSRSPAVQRRLGEITDILARAEKLNGDRQRSVIWFRFQPISSLANHPPAALVAAGHYACVLEHLEDLAEGIYA